MHVFAYTYPGFGEWMTAVTYMGGVFIVAAIGVIGLGVWVVRADRKNRGDEGRIYPADEDDEATGSAH